MLRAFVTGGWTLRSGTENEEKKDAITENLYGNDFPS
jgi:hypothetical protein